MQYRNLWYPGLIWLKAEYTVVVAFLSIYLK